MFTSLTIENSRYATLSHYFFGKNRKPNLKLKYNENNT